MRFLALKTLATVKQYIFAASFKVTKKVEKIVMHLC